MIFQIGITSSDHQFRTKIKFLKIFNKINFFRTQGNKSKSNQINCMYQKPRKVFAVHVS